MYEENVMYHAGGSAQITAPEAAREVSLTVSNAGGVEYCIVAVWR